MLPGYINQHFEPTSANDQRFAFIAEWYDPQAALKRKYQFLFYPGDNSIEMHDIKNRRRFLTRTKVSYLTMDDLFLGSQINVCSRQLFISDFGDPYTQRHLECKNEKSFAMIKPEAISKLGEVLNVLRDNEIEVCRAKMAVLTRENAAEFYYHRKTETTFSTLVNHLSSGPVIAMEIRGVKVISRWRNLIGPQDLDEAREKHPKSLRAICGIDNIQNGFHGSANTKEVARDMEVFFPTKGNFRLIPPTKYENTTCCVIKPHAVVGGMAGDIINAIESAGFSVTDFMVTRLEKANAEEFYDVYKGVLVEYASMVRELSSGPCMALEIHSKDGDTATRFRELCGPVDPEIARHIRPRTLRAIFGKDKIQNAVHCTDLPDDGLIEVEYFFRILSVK